MKWVFLTIISCLLSVSSGYAADCNAVGQRVANQQSGKLSRAELETKDGRSICVVVVIVPGLKGEKPRRVEVAVPAN